MERTCRLRLAHQREELALDALLAEELTPLDVELRLELLGILLRGEVVRLHPLHHLRGLGAEQLARTRELAAQLAAPRVVRAELLRDQRVLDLEPGELLPQFLDERAGEDGRQAVVVAALHELVLGLERDALGFRRGEPPGELHHPLVRHVLLEIGGHQMVRLLEDEETALRLLHAGLELGELRLQKAAHLLRRRVQALQAAAHEETGVRVGDVGGQIRIRQLELHGNEPGAAHGEDGEQLQVLPEERGGIGVLTTGGPAVGQRPEEARVAGQAELVDHPLDQARAAQQIELRLVVVVLGAVEGRLRLDRLAVQDLEGASLDEHRRLPHVEAGGEPAVEAGGADQQPDGRRNPAPAPREHGPEIAYDAALIGAPEQRLSRRQAVRQGAHHRCADRVLLRVRIPVRVHLALAWLLRHGATLTPAPRWNRSAITL